MVEGRVWLVTAVMDNTITIIFINNLKTLKNEINAFHQKPKICGILTRHVKNPSSLAFRVHQELGPQVLMELKEIKALKAHLAPKDSKEQLEIQVVLVTQVPLDQKAPLEMLALLGLQEKLEIQVMQKYL